MLRDLGLNSSELELDLVKVERCLRSLETDDALLPAERDLRRSYYTHWQNKLRFTKHGAVKDHEKPLRSPLNRVKTSDDSWKVITPHALMHAVVTIREDFEEISSFQWREFRKLCHRDLRQLAVGQTESAAFRAHFDNCAAKLAEGIEYIFHRFLKQSLNQNALKGAEVEWVALQVTDLIEWQDQFVERWIKFACDSNPTDCAGGLDFVLQANWRAPKWLWMQPNGYAHYDASTAWEKMDEEETRKALRYLRENRWFYWLESTLRKLVGSAHEELGARQQPTNDSENKASTPSANPETRRKSIQTLLDQRGWSIHDLSVQARVDFHTANRFVKGSAKSYPSTRKKLADALGVSVDELPA